MQIPGIPFRRKTAASSRAPADSNPSPSTAASRWSAARIVVAYVLLAGAWVYFGDRWMQSLPDAQLAAQVGAYKGLLFVLITAGLLYLGLRRGQTMADLPKAQVAGSLPILLIVALLAAAILGIGALAYRDQRALLMEDVAGDLGNETRLKAERIATLYAARQMQGGRIGDDPLVRELLERWERQPAEADRQLLQQWLTSIRVHLRVSRAFITDASGRPMLDGQGLITGPVVEPARLAVERGRIELEDLHQEESGAAHFALVAPIPLGQPGQALAVLVLEDAALPLSDIVRRRISESRSGESYLVRAAGSGAQYLTPLRERPEAMFTPAPASRDRIPVALLGRHGRVLQGLDYRGVRVFAQAEPVPGTPWLLVTQIDEAEALAGLNRVAWFFGGVLLLACALCLMGIHHLLQRGRLRDALARLQQGQALEASEQRFKQAFENASIGMVMCALDGRFLRVNPTMCRLTGYSEAELLQCSFLDITHPEDRPANQRVRDEALAAPPAAVPGYEKRYICKDGSILWVAVSPGVVRDAQGKPLYLFAAINDVSARRRAEREHRLAEERFDLAMRAGEQGVWDWSLLDGKVYVSPAWAQMLGYCQDELVPGIETYQGLMHPDDVPAMRVQVQRVSQREAALYVLDCRMRHRDGHYIDVQSRAYPVFSEDGQLHRLVGSHINISERKAIETALSERAELQQYLSSVAGTVPGALFAFRRRADGSYYFPYVSPPFEAMFGVRGEEMKIDGMPAFARVHPEDLPGLLQSVEAAVGADASWRHEFRMLPLNGGTVWLEGHTAPQRQADGGMMWSGFLHDITERKQQEQKLQQAAKVFSGTREGVVITDPAGTILAVNPAFCDITGYAEAELVGQNMRLLKSGRQDSAFYGRLWDTIRSQGYWQGEMWNRRKNGEIFPEWQTISAVKDEAGRVVNYVGTFTDISRIKQSEAKLEHLAHHDALTGLPNRLVLRSHLDEALVRGRRSGRTGALLMMDLDRFKNVNDSLGHAAGDELLVIAAQRLRAALRESDLLVRQGGDEFVVVLEGLSHQDDAARVARSLIECVSQPFLLSGGHQAYVGLSIGICLFPADGDSAGDVIKHADAALYGAKAAGRGTHRFYNAALTQVAASRLEMETRLRGALERREFTLHYQPLVSLANGRLRGVEALVRWTDSEGNSVSPAEFIPLAEETGLIVPLGEWVLRSACEQVAQWRKDGFVLGTLAVNLSPRQLCLPDIDARVATILAETGLPAEVLELEITEGALGNDTADVQDKVTRLKALGLRIAIDDFGTGYSSLVYLKRFPVDKLKIDRAFVRDVPGDSTDAEIISAIIALATILRLEVLAEGVENAAQLNFLLQHGCSSGQGFLFSKAVPPERIREMALEAANEPQVAAA